MSTATEINSNIHSLPPGVVGVQKGVVSLTVDEIVGFLGTASSGRVRCEWWGSNKEEQAVFLPSEVGGLNMNMNVTESGGMQHHTYPVKCSREKLNEYFNDANPLTLYLVDGLVGRAEVTLNLAGVDEFVSLIGSDGKMVASIHVRLLYKDSAVVNREAVANVHCVSANQRRDPHTNKLMKLDKLDNSDKENTTEEASVEQGKSKLQFKYRHTMRFKCLTCDKKLASEDGMKKHIKNLHSSSDPNIVYYTSFIHAKKVSNISAITPPPQSESQAEQCQQVEIVTKKSMPTFVSPALKANSKQSKFQAQTNTGITQGSSTKKPGKKVNFSQSLTNMFTNGKLEMEKVSMWGKNHKTDTKLRGQNQNDPFNTTPASHSRENASSSSSGDGVCNNVVIRSISDPLECEEDDDIQGLDGQQMKEPEIVLEIGEKLETSKNIKVHPRPRKKRTCGYVDCEPCSIHTDCMECKFCKNKKQKK